MAVIRKDVLSFKCGSFAKRYPDHEATDLLQEAEGLIADMDSEIEELRAALHQPDLDGYRTAFFEIGEMLGLTAQASSPKNVWEAQMRPALQAALAAQPSPGGQGGLNYERMFVDACAALAEVSRELGCDPEQGGAEPILTAIAELREAIAARQPVGEPVAVVTTSGRFTYGKLNRDLPDGTLLYAAQPAQAVDLGQFREAVLQAFLRDDDAFQRGFIGHKQYAEAEAKRDRLLALIDGKAVGNG